MKIVWLANKYRTYFNLPYIDYLRWLTRLWFCYIYMCDVCTDWRIADSVIHKSKSSILNYGIYTCICAPCAYIEKHSKIPSVFLEISYDRHISNIYRTILRNLGDIDKDQRYYLSSHFILYGFICVRIRFIEIKGIVLLANIKLCCSFCAILCCACALKPKVEALRGKI